MFNEKKKNVEKQSNYDKNSQTSSHASQLLNLKPIQSITRLFDILTKNMSFDNL